MARVDLLVLGAGLAGLRTVQAFRRAGGTGSVLLAGEEVHQPYDRPPLSKAALLDDAGMSWLKADWAGLGAQTRLGDRAVGLDPVARRVEFAAGPPVTYGRVVVATGATPRRLPGSPAGTHVLRSLADVAGLRAELRPGRSLAVIGAGFVGCELASSAVRHGVRTTLVDPLPAPLAGALGPEVGGRIADLHRAHGVELRCGVGVAGIDPGPVLRLSDGGTIAADVVVQALGVTPDCGWLAGSGLDLADGVLCDEYGTAAPGVHAVGDVSRWWHPLYRAAVRFEHWTNAVDQALALGHSLARPEAPKPCGSVPYFWSDQHGVKLQALGRPSGADDVLVTGEADRPLAFYSRGGLLTAVVGIDRPKDVISRRAALATPTPLAAVLP